MALQVDFSGKVIVVCGSGAGGIGSAVSDILIDAGAALVAVDYKQELVDETVAAAKAKGGEAVGLTLDLTDRAQVAKVIPETIKAFGRVDGVVNVAGGTTADQWREFETIPDEMIDPVFALNFDYAFQVCRDAAKVMIAQGDGGAIVNIASISGHAGAPYHALYGAAKAAVISISRTMGLEWKRYNIRVNALSPGLVLTKRVVDRSLSQPADDNTFGRRKLKPEEVAGATLFLLSDLASAVTAQNLNVDVGITSNFAAFPDLGAIQGRLWRDPA